MSDEQQQNKPEPLTGLKDLLKVGRDIITDEGVEERIVRTYAQVITITGGGKHRVYGVAHGRPTDLGCYDSVEEAEKVVAHAMMLGGVAMHDPMQAFELLKQAAEKAKNK